MSSEIVTEYRYLDNGTEGRHEGRGVSGARAKGAEKRNFQFKGKFVLAQILFIIEPQKGIL